MARASAKETAPAKKTAPARKTAAPKPPPAAAAPSEAPPPQDPPAPPADQAPEAGAAQQDAALESANFEPGASGWRIAGDGAAEFNEVVPPGTPTCGLDRIEQAQALPEVDADTVTVPLHFAPGAIRRFKASPTDRRTMEIVALHGGGLAMRAVAEEG